MSNVIDFEEYLQKRAATTQPETSVKEPDIVLLYQLLHEMEEWFYTEEGQDFWCEEVALGYAIELSNLMVKMRNEPRDEVVSAFLRCVRNFTDYICNCVNDRAPHRAIALEIVEAFKPIVPQAPVPTIVPEASKGVAPKKMLPSMLLEFMKARRHSVKEMATMLGTHEGAVRGAITVLRERGYKIVNYPSDHTFGFEEGAAPPLGPVGGGDDRWKRWA